MDVAEIRKSASRTEKLSAFDSKAVGEVKEEKAN